MRFADFDLDDTPDGFAESLARLDSLLPDIPPGWHAIYNQCLRTLRGMDCPSRAHVRLAQPNVQLGVLEIRQLVPATRQVDPVVQGILRKLTARALCTCQRCGRAATWRPSDTSANIDLRDRIGAGSRIRMDAGSLPDGGTFCVRCLVPVELQSELSTWLQRMQHDELFQRSYAVIPLHHLKPCLRALIPPPRIEALKGKRRCCRIEYVQPKTLLALRKDFRDLKTYLDDLLQEEREEPSP